MTENPIPILIALIAAVVVGALFVFFGGALFETENEAVSPARNETATMNETKTTPSTEQIRDEVLGRIAAVSDHALMAKIILEEDGMPSKLAVEIGNDQNARTDVYENTESRYSCIFQKGEGQIGNGTWYQTICYSYPQFIHRVHNDTISLTFTEENRFVVESVIEKYNQEGYELKSVVPIVMEEWPNGEPLNAELLYAILQR